MNARLCRGRVPVQDTIRCAVAIAILTCCGQYASAQSVVYLVRHAEKQSEEPNSPLSDTGLKRADTLAGFLKTARVRAIYTSDALRTQQTANTLATKCAIPLTIIPHGDPDETFSQIKANHPHDSVLVVGHSNTIGPLIKRWVPDADIHIGPDEFNNIFVVIPEGATAGWVRFEYGAQ